MKEIIYLIGQISVEKEITYQWRKEVRKFFDPSDPSNDNFEMIDPCDNEWNKDISNIKKPSMKLVFIDEGKVTPDSYAVLYNEDSAWCSPNESWFDPPMVRHGNGMTASFADGHAEYKKWINTETVELGEKQLICQQPTQDGSKQDLYWMQYHCWGQLGYDPSVAPEYN